MARDRGFLGRPGGRAPSEPDRVYGSTLGAELALTEACGPHLAEVLAGTSDPLSLLFPGGSANMAEALYQVRLPAVRSTSFWPRGVARGCGIGGQESADPHPRDWRRHRGDLVVRRCRRCRPRESSYLFTDVSPAFTARAARKFAAFPFVRYQPLDIERDPAGQGLRGRTIRRHHRGQRAPRHARPRRDVPSRARPARTRRIAGMLEMTRPQRWVDCDLRPDRRVVAVHGSRTSAHLSAARRARLARVPRVQGFGEVVTAPTLKHDGLFDLQSVVMARAPRTSAAA